MPRLSICNTTARTSPPELRYEEPLDQVSGRSRKHDGSPVVRHRRLEDPVDQLSQVDAEGLCLIDDRRANAYWLHTGSRAALVPQKGVLVPDALSTHGGG